MTAGGKVDQPIARHGTQRQKMAVVAGGKQAISHYRVINRFRAHTHVKVKLETGRTHQVRVHCASIGHALLGDPVYGRAPKALKPLLDELGFKRQALHAARLGFKHPISAETLDFCAELPRDMRELIDQTAR